MTLIIQLPIVNSCKLYYNFSSIRVENVERLEAL